MSESKKSQILKTERTLSWLIVFFTALLVTAGYSMTHGLLDRPFLLQIHLLSEWFFMGLLILHIIVMTFIVKFPWRLALNKIKNGEANQLLLLKTTVNITGMGILISAFLVIMSGLTYYFPELSALLPFFQHLQYDIVLLISIIIHVAANAKVVFIRKNKSSKQTDILIIGLAIFLMLAVLLINPL